MTDMSEAVNEEEQATQLPTPTGYRMLCALPEVEDKFSNGILKPDALTKLNGLCLTGLGLNLHI